MAAELGHAPNRAYIDQSGNIHLNGASFFDASENDLAVPLATAVAGVAAGYKIARGATALSGSNPTSIVTGLTTIVAFVATLQRSSAPTTNTSTVTATFTGGTASVYAWTLAGGVSSGTETVSWIAIGT